MNIVNIVAQQGYHVLRLNVSNAVGMNYLLPPPIYILVYRCIAGTINIINTSENSSAFL